MTATLTERFYALPHAPWQPALALRAGGARDYEDLAEHHYLAQRPATITRVLVLEGPGPSVAQRWARQVSSSKFQVSSWAGSRGGGRCAADLSCPTECVEEADQGRARAAVRVSDLKPETWNLKLNVAAVLVESLPALNCALRDVALPGRYAGWRDLRQRARLINGEIRCLSRVIVDPRFRGLGLAVGLVQAALDTATTPYTEALAAMGHVHPFFERAGLRAYRRPGHPWDQRLKAALAACALAVTDLARSADCLRKIDALPPGRRRWLLAELERWGNRTRSFKFQVSGFKNEPGPAVADLLRVVRQKLLREPVYYLAAKPRSS